MAKSFRCRLITPEAAIFDDAAVYASVPAWDGLFGVLPDRAPIVARLGLGELRIDFAPRDGAAGGSRAFLVDGGFVQMASNQLTILADHAEPVESLSESDARAELERLNTDADDAPHASDADRRAARARRLQLRRRAQLRLRLAQRYRTRGI